MCRFSLVEMRIKESETERELTTMRGFERIRTF